MILPNLATYIIRWKCLTMPLRFDIVLKRFLNGVAIQLASQLSIFKIKLMINIMSTGKLVIKYLVYPILSKLTSALSTLSQCITHFIFQWPWMAQVVESGARRLNSPHFNKSPPEDLIFRSVPIFCQHWINSYYTSRICILEGWVRG